MGELAAFGTGRGLQRKPWQLLEGGAEGQLMPVVGFKMHSTVSTQGPRTWERLNKVPSSGSQVVKTTI